MRESNYTMSILSLDSRKIIIVTVIAIIAFTGVYTFYTGNWQRGQAPLMDVSLSECSGSLTILYDNYDYDSSCQAEWGFSCLVELEDQTILFDTGGEPDVLMDNIEALGVDPMDIDCIVISHEHWDHIGGIHAVLDVNSEVTVYLPACFSNEFKEWVGLKADVVETENATMICDSVCTTRVLHEGVSEQSLMIETCEGIILITGCSHPGVHNLVEDAANLTGEDVYFVMGGYHLGGASEHMLNVIIHRMEECGVEKVAPTHCTGDDSIDAFNEAWGDDCLTVGVGFRMEF